MHCVVIGDVRLHGGMRTSSELCPLVSGPEEMGYSVGVGRGKCILETQSYLRDKATSAAVTKFSFSGNSNELTSGRP